MHKLKQLPAYLLLRLMVAIFSILPWSAVYRFSDFMAWVLRKVVKYRIKLVKQQATTAFPHWSAAELDQFTVKTYQNLTDIMCESIKGLSIPPAKLMHHFSIMEQEKVNPHVDGGRNVILLGGHFTNWEWAARTVTMHNPNLFNCIYKPIKNQYINEYFRTKNQPPRMEMLAMGSVFKAFKERTQAQYYVLIADQSPSNLEYSYWIDFLGRDTAVMNGPAMLACEFDAPVYFMSFTRTSRGQYRIDLTPISITPQQDGPEAITRKYFELLEKDIRDRPHCWLWTHRRWKHTRKAT